MNGGPVCLHPVRRQAARERSTDGSAEPEDRQNDKDDHDGPDNPNDASHHELLI
jgi:hypothetical protein